MYGNYYKLAIARAVKKPGSQSVQTEPYICWYIWFSLNRLWVEWMQG